MKKILLLATATGNAKPVLWCLKRANYDTIALGNISKNSSLKYSILCRKFFELSEKYSFEANSSEIISIIKDIVEKEKIDIVIPSGFDSVKFLSIYRNELSKFSKVLTVPGMDVIEALGNKYKFSIFCKQNTIAHPRTYLLTNIDHISGGNLGLDFPIVTKPLNLSSSIGVKKFSDKVALEKYLLLKQGDESNALPLLLQEFIPGNDLGFNVFATNGIINAWAIQHFIEIPIKGREPFKWLKFGRNDSVFRIGEAIIKKSNYTGPANIDMRIDSRDNTVRAIEVNTRFWATTAYSLCDGINFIDVAIKASFDPKYKVDPRCSNHLWGNFWKLPMIAVKKRDITVFRYLPHFSAEQVRYITQTFFIELISFLRKLFKDKKVFNYVKD